VNWYFVDLHGNRVGPVPHERFCMMFADGTLGLATLVWTEQYKDWIEAVHVAGFRELARTAPPPRPPPLPPLASLAPGEAPPVAPPPLPVAAIPLARRVDPAAPATSSSDDAWPEPAGFNSHAVAPTISGRRATAAEPDGPPADGSFNEDDPLAADGAHVRSGVVAGRVGVRPAGVVIAVLIAVAAAGSLLVMFLATSNRGPGASERAAAATAAAAAAAEDGQYPSDGSAALEVEQE
jgi:hypothetical protein